MITEYKNVNDSNRARRELLREHYSSKVKTNVRLVKVSKGWEPAGSCARWTNGFYAVLWEAFGATQGRRYKLDDFQSAQSYYENLTWADMGKLAWQS